MLDDLDEFIQLDRTFHDLALSEEEGKDAELFRLMRREKPAQWPDLLAEPRVVLLSEAGSGKTEEIRHVCRDLRQCGQRAFFLRIEHLALDFDGSFEEGTSEEFEDWIASGEDGWLLLDSVDEARLKDPKDFERAIRTIGRKLRGALQRAHIVITSRGEAWRPKTDLLLCETNLSWIPPVTAPGEDQESDEAVTTTDGANSKQRKSVFRIVALDDLAGNQVGRFAEAKGVIDVAAFRKALDRAEAWSFTTRPLDLAETIEFWLANGPRRLASRAAAREHRQASRGTRPGPCRTPTRSRRSAFAKVVSLVAAASILAKESAGTRARRTEERPRPRHQAGPDRLGRRRLPHAPHQADLRRRHLRYCPLPPPVGPRVPHRRMASFSAGRRRIARARREPVLPPAIRRRGSSSRRCGPILPWLAILDQRILERVMRLAPEVLLEGGDPAQLPLETRNQILRESCEQLAQPAHGRSITEYSAVQRFTNPDLADVIRELLEKHKDDDDIVWFLVRMVQQGGIAALADKAKLFALTSRSRNTRASPPSGPSSRWGHLRTSRTSAWRSSRSRRRCGATGWVSFWTGSATRRPTWIGSSRPLRPPNPRSSLRPTRSPTRCPDTWHRCRLHRSRPCWRGSASC